MSIATIVSAMVTRMKKEQNKNVSPKRDTLKKGQKKKDGCRSDAAGNRISTPDPEKSQITFKDIL